MSRLDDGPRAALDEIEWGVRITLGDGTTVVEPAPSRGLAWRFAVAMRKTSPWWSRKPTTRSELVYRHRTASAWLGDPDVGNDFAVQRVWPLGHTEIEPARSRHDAETRMRLSNASSSTATAAVVSRTVEIGQWLEADKRVGF